MKKLINDHSIKRFQDFLKSLASIATGYVSSLAYIVIRWLIFNVINKAYNFIVRNTFSRHDDVMKLFWEISFLEALKSIKWFSFGYKRSMGGPIFILGAQFYMRTLSGTQNNVCSKPKCRSDQDTTRNIVFCSFLPK